MKDAKEWMGTLAGNDFDIEKFIRQVQQDAIDTVLSSINTEKKTGLDENLLEKGIDQPDSQGNLSNKKDRLYTAKDMESFAEFLIGRNTEWITELERNETAKTLIELWEKEMRKKED